MMDVLIVSKTRMAHHSCVGGILIQNGRFVRLLDVNGNNQPANSNLEIRDVWEIDFENRQNVVPPHVEDILVREFKNKRQLKSNLTMLDVLKMLNIKYWEGRIDNIFDGYLNWTVNGSGYISKDLIPEHSVGFWLTDKELTMYKEYEKIRYHYDEINDSRKITYVGFDEPVNIIPAGTLLRVSLARWWSPSDSDVEERCYLQLSGWYDIDKMQDDDLPF